MARPSIAALCRPGPPPTLPNWRRAVDAPRKLSTGASGAHRLSPSYLVTVARDSSGHHTHSPARATIILGLRQVARSRDAPRYAVCGHGCPIHCVGGAPCCICYVVSVHVMFPPVMSCASRMVAREAPGCGGWGEGAPGFPPTSSLRCANHGRLVSSREPLAQTDIAFNKIGPHIRIRGSRDHGTCAWSSPGPCVHEACSATTTHTYDTAHTLKDAPLPRTCLLIEGASREGSPIVRHSARSAQVS